MKVGAQIVDGYGNVDQVDIEVIQKENHSLLKLSFQLYDDVIMYHDNEGNLAIEFIDWTGRSQIHALGG